MSFHSHMQFTLPPMTCVILVWCHSPTQTHRPHLVWHSRGPQRGPQMSQLSSDTRGEGERQPSLQLSAAAADVSPGAFLGLLVI